MAMPNQMYASPVYASPSLPPQMAGTPYYAGGPTPYTPNIMSPQGKI